MFKRKKGLLLHPQQRQRSFKNWQAIDTKEKKFSKIKIKKSLWEIKELFTFAPRKTREVPWEIDKREWFKRDENLKKNFIFFLPVKKRISTFAPANRNNEKRKKQEEYVPRHIELTAVLLKDKTKKKRVR